MQFKFRNTQYAIKPTLWSMLFVIFTVALTASLAYWQYERGRASQVRQTLLDNISKETLPLTSVNLDHSIRNYTAIHAQGQWLLPTLLVDSQILTQGQNKSLGFHVYSILKTSRGNLLVRRGWQIDHPYKELGLIKPPQTNNITFLSYTPEPNRFQTYWPVELDSHMAIIPSLNLAKISNSLNLKLLPFIGLLEQTLPEDNLQAIPINKQTYLSPDKHFAYALQWLILCLIAPIIYFFAALKKVVKTTNTPKRTSL